MIRIYHCVLFRVPAVSLRQKPGESRIRWIEQRSVHPILDNQGYGDTARTEKVLDFEDMSLQGFHSFKSKITFAFFCSLEEIKTW
jgi:hypothetical protein